MERYQIENTSHLANDIMDVPSHVSISCPETAQPPLPVIMYASKTPFRPSPLEKEAETDGLPYIRREQPAYLGMLLFLCEKQESERYGI